jgi:hypothetical protein
MQTSHLVRDAFMEYLHQGTIKAKEIGKTNNLYVTVIVISLKSIDVIHSFVRSFVRSFVHCSIIFIMTYDYNKLLNK